MMKTNDPPRISIVIPVYHEAERITTLLDHLNDLDARRVSERIVVEGASEGDTLSAIEDPAVITVRSPRGRASQMNDGAEAASGDTLLFLHADTTLPQGALEMIEKTVTDGAIVGGAFRIRFASRRWMFRLFGAVDSWRARITRIPYGDQAIFIKRRYFNRIGRYSDIPLMEDVDLMKRIRRRGDRIRILDAAVTSSTRRWEREGVIYCTARNCVLLALYSLGISPHFLKRFYPDDPPPRVSIETRLEGELRPRGERGDLGGEI